MKLKYISALLFFISILSFVHAQDGRTAQTKVADVFALFPAKNKADADRLFRDLITLNDEGLYLVTSRVLPNGKEEGVAARYAISLLTHHASDKKERSRIENANQKALAKASDLEEKA